MVYPRPPHQILADIQQWANGNQSTIQSDPEIFFRAVCAREILQILYQMSPEEAEEQRRSFAFGNVAISNPTITRKDIDNAAERYAKQLEQRNPLTETQP